MKKIGIIGSGQVAQSLGKGFIKHNYEVMLGTRDAAKLSKWKEDAGSHAQVGSFEDAAKFGDDIYQIFQNYINHGPPKISRMAKDGLDRMTWMANLNMIALSSVPKNEKLRVIIKGILAQPTKRLTRFSLGCIKNILLS